MSEYDDSDRLSDEEEEEEEERVEDKHKNRLTAAQEWILDAVARRKNMIVEGSTGKAKLTEEDVDEFFKEFSDLAHDANENTPTVLHVLVGLVSSTVGASIESATVKELVRRLVQQSSQLLCVRHHEDHMNPLYFAISKKRKLLADYMVMSCPQEGSQRRHLAMALEDCCGSDKNCLHLAFEKDLKLSTLLRMVKEANITALEAVDATGKRPMHYAVRYTHFNVKVIRAFIERDIEVLGQAPRNQPPQTFLDDEGTNTSVYQEHVSSAEAFTEERSSKKGITDHRMNLGESSTRDDGGKHTRDKMDETLRGRNQVAKSKPEHHFELVRSEHKFVARPDEANSAALRDPGNAQDRIGRPQYRDQDKRIGADGALSELERERERLKREEAEARKRELGQPPVVRDGSKDRQSLGPAGGRRQLQPPLPSRHVERRNSDIAANTPKPLRRVPTMHDDNAAEEPETRAKRSTAATKKSRKTFDHEAAARDSETVLRMLKLHYMRTRDLEKATWWLYKTNPQDVQTFFDHRKLITELKEKLFEEAFSGTKFDEVLKFVHFPNVTVIPKETPKSKNARSRGGFGRRDMEFFFNFLYKKGVRYILKVIVEEGGQSVHSDEAIKNALNPFIVEHLDWRKVDLDPQLICGISSQAEEAKFDESGLVVKCNNQLRHLDLQWSGNNAVLRAWSEPEGLPSLQQLQTVNIVVPEDTTMYDSPEWILKKKTEFEERLHKHCAIAASEEEKDQDKDQPPPRPPVRRKVIINLEGVNPASKKEVSVGSLRLGATRSPTSQSAPHKVINTHEWLKCMDAFARNIKPLWESTQATFLRGTGGTSQGSADHGTTPRPATITGLENDVIVALIDDGVSLLDQNFVGRVLEGKTFDYRGDVIGQSYNSARGHGTEMARCILRVCPMAKIYPIRLKTQLSADETKSEIDLKSATSAIYAALEKKATIISMSWTIPVLQDPTPEQKDFEAAVREASSRNVLMFCSSPDEGNFHYLDYPSAAQRDKVFRIGAAHDHGQPSKYADKDVDFIFPGVQVNVGGGGSGTGAASGSSIATALAAGLAAAVIYCHKICALALKAQSQAVMSPDETSRGKFSETAVLRLSQHAVMKGAFGRIGWVNDTKFIQIWDELQPVVQALEDPDNMRNNVVKVGIIRDLCAKLV